jgi:hypothetical protein
VVVPHRSDRSGAAAGGGAGQHSRPLQHAILTIGLLAGIFAFAILPPILGAFGLSTSTALQISFFLIPPLVLAAMLRMHRRKLPQSLPRSLYIFIYPYSLLGAAILGAYFFLHAIPGGSAGSQEPAVLLTAALFAVAGRMVLTNVLQHQRQDELADLRPPRIL